MPSAPRRVAVVAMVLLLHRRPSDARGAPSRGLLSSRLPATMCVRRGCGLSRIDVFLRGIAFRHETRAVTSTATLATPASRGHMRRYARGLTPNSARNRRENCDGSGQPTAAPMAATDCVGRHQQAGGALGPPPGEVAHRRHADAIGRTGGRGGTGRHTAAHSARRASRDGSGRPPAARTPARRAARSTARSASGPGPSRRLPRGSPARPAGAPAPRAACAARAAAPGSPRGPRASGTSSGSSSWRTTTGRSPLGTRCPSGRTGGAAPCPGMPSAARARPAPRGRSSSGPASRRSCGTHARHPEGRAPRFPAGTARCRSS